jgi:hypothetical protein
MGAGHPEGTPRAHTKPLAGCVVLHNELHVTGHGNLGTLGAAREGGLKLVNLDVQVTGNGRQNINVSPSGSNLEGLHALRALLDVDELPGLER